MHKENKALRKENAELKKSLEEAEPFLSYIYFLASDKGEDYKNEYIRNYKKDVESFKRIVRKGSC